jgi:hypothetical protein
MEEMPKNTKEHHKYALWCAANRIKKKVERNSVSSAVCVFYYDVNQPLGAIVIEDNKVDYVSHTGKNTFVCMDYQYEEKEVWIVRELLMKDLAKIRKEKK